MANFRDMKSEQDIYQIPSRFRKIENLHIVLWLIKDLCWVMLWKPLGLIMIVPTIGAALLITWQTRENRTELLHNIAVVFWITANGYWMITEFFSKDDSLRYYAVIPFACGLISIAYYYFGVIFPAKNNPVADIRLKEQTEKTM